MRHLTAVQQCQQPHIIHRPSQTQKLKEIRTTTRTSVCHLSALSEPSASRNLRTNINYTRILARHKLPLTLIFIVSSLSARKIFAAEINNWSGVEGATTKMPRKWEVGREN